MSAPEQVIIGERTVRRLGSVRVGASNIWHRSEHGGGPSARIAIGDHSRVVAVGNRVDAGGEAWEVVAIEAGPGATGSVAFQRAQVGEPAVSEPPSR